MRSRSLGNYAFLCLVGMTLSFYVSAEATAEDLDKGGGFTPTTGEPIEYGKKFHPTERSRSYFMEINPLLLFGQSLALETEANVGDGFTLGIDFRYRDSEVHKSDGVKGTHTYLGIAPKARFYPLPTLSGVFVGLKLLLGQVTSSIDSFESKSWDDWIVSPVAHVGYRITSSLGLTLALYIGGGLNIPALSITESDFPTSVLGSAEESARWRDAAGALNQQESRFNPDFGLTLGAAF